MEIKYDSMLAICWILDPVQNSNFSFTELNTFNGDTNDISLTVDSKVEPHYSDLIHFQEVQ